MLTATTRTSLFLWLFQKGLKLQFSLSFLLTDVHSWIVCDGDVDPEWIESLNSVLDDNRLLTLPSGWRIQFGPNVNFMFETHDLSFASPATISRMGMIFLRCVVLCISKVSSLWHYKFWLFQSVLFQWWGCQYQRPGVCLAQEAEWVNCSVSSTIDWWLFLQR